MSKTKDSTPTIHNSAKLGEIAKTVLMPGDPVRAQFIAENFLDNVKMVSDVRRIPAYTGFYDGKAVSVMASGMGSSSMSIYAKELFDFYEVDNIIRVGSAGGLSDKLKLGDIVLAQCSCTDSSYPSLVGFPGVFSPCADFSLLEKAADYCRKHSIRFLAGPVFSGEIFYYAQEKFEKLADFGMLAVEMESASLYTTAAISKKKALAICTVSDMVFTGEASTTEEREKTFTNMIKLALNIAQ